ncbi:hypothetical protein CspHIS471_0103050 [Cutaneotrichosporon sp. HIS471]|nr:hypothetical protein CspHIS471_0103050 [Cutaneotrichosporon sp. HIS471]
MVAFTSALTILTFAGFASAPTVSASIATLTYFPSTVARPQRSEARDYHRVSTSMATTRLFSRNMSATERDALSSTTNGLDA